ncbi:MAG: redox-regulated ATPase YchF [Deltaproteobacteria bacterium]|nr:redox-regulated ATPase YchF [Deltaproteobacteria bacterium]
MKIGIVGFAGSGKTTLFNALTGQDAPTGFGSGKINLGVIKVPDRRVDRLAEIDDPRKVTYAEITFADVPGGRGDKNIDSQTLGRIREMDALVQVVRGFDDGSGPPDPTSEVISFESELLLADMQVAEKRAERLEKDRSDPRQLGLLKQCLEKLGEEVPLRDAGLTEEELAPLTGFAFLSLKPMLLVLNLSEDKASEPIPEDLLALADKRGIEVMPLSGPIEAEIATLDHEDQQEFLQDLGLAAPASTRFIQSAFSMLDLISFLTHGEDECRAWSIRRGSTALEAAGAVHSDLARGFIRAEVIHFDDFDKLESEAVCRDNGKLQIEGKDYIVQDGDICHIRFNV